ncbi:MAG: hypothetical protein UHZ05_01820 [Acutalibacteraceae bacterium]|nr:hypothetical protein [Clostridia bacterium]MEE1126967.1 hypothetical protein [Acutalibacteraceae bacterium]MBQ2318631.1 hypothetical protein [Clostridia bacterium]MBQ2387703.1 hypothetical protein [Clostridia bacterium]MBQ2419879.1 hypothetical protein [Clostridia bacterium]
MYCKNGIDECNGCGWCQSERCDICGEKASVVYYGGKAHCSWCEIKRKKRRKNDR